MIPRKHPRAWFGIHLLCIGLLLIANPSSINAQQEFNRHETTRPWMVFDVDFRASDYLPDIAIKDVALCSDGLIYFGDEAVICYHHPPTAPVPLGSTGLALYGMAIDLYPKQKIVCLKSELATYPPPGNLLRLHSQITLDLRLKKAELIGKLMIADLHLLTIDDAEICPRHITATLIVPGEEAPLPLYFIYYAKASFLLNSEGLKMAGSFTLLQSYSKEMTVHILWIPKLRRFHFANGCKCQPIRNLLESRWFGAKPLEDKTDDD